MDEMKMKRKAIIGFIGGVLFAIGDLLVYILPNVHNQSRIYDDWISMSDLRPAFATYFGCIGAGLLLIGFCSWYAAIKENATIRLKYLMMSIVFGILLTPIGHFVIACMTPMIYKGAVQAGVSSEQAMETVAYLTTYTEPIKGLVMFFIILVQSVTMIALIVKRKIHCPRWMVIFNPMVFSILSIPLSILLNGTGLEGITGSLESLGEGFLYVPVYYHWKQ